MSASSERLWRIADFLDSAEVGGQAGAERLTVDLEGRLLRALDCYRRVLTPPHPDNGAAWAVRGAERSVVYDAAGLARRLQRDGHDSRDLFASVFNAAIEGGDIHTAAMSLMDLSYRGGRPVAMLAAYDSEES